MVPWGVIIFFVGIAYGFFAKGRQDKGHLVKRGLVIGFAVGVALAVLGFLIGAPALGVSGFVGAIVAAIVLTIVFVIGVWIGDLLEGKR